MKSSGISRPLAYFDLWHDFLWLAKLDVRKPSPRVSCIASASWRTLHSRDAEGLLPCGGCQPAGRLASTDAGGRSNICPVCRARPQPRPLILTLNPYRLSKPCRAEPVLDLSFLIDYVMEEVKPLHWEEVLASPIPLKIVASCLDQLRPVILEVRASAAQP